MPIETALWRLDGDVPSSVNAGGIDLEDRLERILLRDVEMLGLGPLIILGNQVVTAYGGEIDILAVDSELRLHVIELKRARTPRDVVAQTLDYGSWVRDLSLDDIADLYSATAGESLADAFLAKFGVELDGEPLEPQLVIVCSTLDPASERIVDYLGKLGVGVNVVFFQVFSDADREYLSRSWLIDPGTAERRVAKAQGRGVVSDLNSRRYAFWEAFLLRSNATSPLLRGRSAVGRQSIGISRGPNARFNYVVLIEGARVELLLRGSNPRVNRAIFESLERNRAEIEAACGESLSWAPSEWSDRIRIETTLEGSGLDDRDGWNDLHDRMVATMERLVAAIDPHLDEALKAGELAPA